MAFDFPFLSALLGIPLFAALFVMMTGGERARAEQNAKLVALYGSMFNLFIALVTVAAFDRTSAAFQFEEVRPWLGGAITYHVGVDGISILFVLLSAFLTPVCILASWHSIKERVKEYLVAFLLMETMMIGVFVSLDLVLFYLFFEAGLIPMFLIIGIWGGKRRVYAAFKFFLYTLLGSLLMLIALIAIYIRTGTTDIAELLLRHNLPAEMQPWLWLAFFASFAVKMPMWPVHTWLPDAHVEAPTAGSVLLAAVLLKMGGYGFLRFSVPMFPIASEMFAPLIFALSVVAIVYTSYVALVQEDMKKLIAYSSVAHMGFVTMGIFTLTRQGVDGALFQMLSHGIVSGALFLCVGVLYDRLHTREIAHYGGIANRMPVYATVFMIFTLANVGLPGTSGFVGEFLTIVGAFKVSTWLAALAATGVILSAAYALHLYRRVSLGELAHDTLKTLKDMTYTERAVLFPLVAIAFWLGLYPKPALDIFAPSVKALIEAYDEDLAVHRAGVEEKAGRIAVAREE